MSLILGFVLGVSIIAIVVIKIALNIIHDFLIRESY